MFEIRKLKITQLQPNSGQIPGVPANPRQWTRTEIDRIAKSIRETPELFSARPIIVYPLDGKYIILGGNLRFEGCKANMEKTVPCIIVPAEWNSRKLGEIVLKDNGSFGEWNYEALLEEYDDIDFEELGIKFPDAEDYSGRNTEIDPSLFRDTITLKLKFNEPQATMVRYALGDDPKQTLLTALHYEN